MNKDDVPLILLCCQVINAIAYDYMEQETYNRDIVMTLTASKCILEDLVDVLIQQKYTKEGTIQPISVEYLMQRIGAVPIKNNN